MNKCIEMFASISEHLLNDNSPSMYIDQISILPEFNSYPFKLLLELKKSEQSPKHHPEGNVWNHTMLVLDEAAKRKNQSKNALVFMWAALLHDIGKPATTRIRKGKITAYNHDVVGATLSIEFLSSLNAPSSFIDDVSALIRFHMHILFVTEGLPFGNVEELKKSTDVREVALLGLCDRLGRTGAHSDEEENKIQLFLSKIKKEERK